MEYRRSALTAALAASVLSCTCLPALAQQKNAAAPAAATVVTSTGITIEQQWEYIVVSYGKTLFGTPQKTLAYRAIGLGSTGQEASDLENSLDILGRFGWEVVSIVGSIGGDQQIVLKRKYNKALSSNEYKAILNGKEIYIKDLIDIMEREQRLRDEEARSADSDKGKLIDLDAAEKKAKRLAHEAELIKAYQDGFAASDFAKYSTATSDYSGGAVHLRITADVTSNMLKDGNSYRKSEVDTFINPKLWKFRFKSPLLGRDETVDIEVNAVIQFNGTAISVGRYYVRWSSILAQWI